MPPSTRRATRRTAAHVVEVNSEVEDQARASSSVNIQVAHVNDERSEDNEAQGRAPTPELRQESHYFGQEEVNDQPSVTRPARTATTVRAKREAPTDREEEQEKRRRIESPSSTHSSWDRQTVVAPARRDPNGHSITYHHPLLLNNLAARQDLLTWFDSVASNRAMPWRKPWVNPAADDLRNPASARQLLEKRAYEVWISEVMLQQTRVATVIEYWNRWMAKWPTIQDLAAADHQEVLDAWKGLGYYNRATRIHKAAKKICESYDGLIPDDPDVLEAEMDGVGKYTAGAIAAIVFGKAVPLVDGNVLRVLSRQMGLFGDVQKDKRVIRRIWSAARELAEQVVRDEVWRSENGHVEEEDLEEHAEVAVHDGQPLPLSDKPGQWGQALMELGSTLCTPLKPDCTACPISSTCRAYSEGFALAIHDGQIMSGGTRDQDYAAPPRRPREQVLRDIEDLCKECDAEEEGTAALCTDGNTNVKFRQVNKGKPYLVKSILTPDAERTVVNSARGFAMIAHHAEKYPPRAATKKKHKLQDSHVFALRRVSDGRFMVQRRPPNGLLPNMWELPSDTVDRTTTTTTSSVETPVNRGIGGDNCDLKEKDIQILCTLAPSRRLDRIIESSELLISLPACLDNDDDYIFREWDEAGGKPKTRYIGELGVIPWTFSHIKMTMFVHLFELDDTHPETKRHHHWAMYGRTQRWLTPPQVDEMTMGGGMLKCWGLVKKAAEDGRVST